MALTRSGVFLLVLLGRWLQHAQGTDEAGTRFLEAKRVETGVVARPSGLLYRVLKSGDPRGKSPLIDSPCLCHYTGRFIDGTVFDSSEKRGRPAKFAPEQVIEGWTEAMQLMREGDTWELFIPSELAYGSRGKGRIPPHTCLVFTLSILRVRGKFKEIWGSDAIVP